MADSGYALDLYKDLARGLSELSPQLATAPPSALPSSTDLPAFAEATPSTEAVNERLSALRNAFSKLEAHDRRRLTAERLTSLVEQAFPPFQGLSSVETAQTESVVLLAKMTAAAAGVVVGQLIEEAGKLGQEDAYWASIEGDRWATGLFLVQSTPSRFISLASTSVSRLRAITTSSLHSDTPSQSLLSLGTFRNALPPTLLLTSIFPHLNSTISLDSDDHLTASANRISRRTRKLILLSFSPLALTRQEVAKKRREIKVARDDLATQIGAITLALSQASHLGGTLSSESLTLSTLGSSTWESLILLDAVLSPSPSLSALPPPSSADFALSLHYLLRTVLPSHTTSFSNTFTSLRRPGILTRSWPYLLSIPLVTVVAGRTIYNSREQIKKWVMAARETVEGFVVDWVVEPVKKILETVRHGDGGTMAIMGKESLRSDLESLERMVVDFGRDEYRLSEDQLRELAEKVRVGDLTSVLRVWEKDIKSPIRSAVSGSLIRTLLIQVQKVKVDVALAMDGIEKMLQSQQLTFGFVGVAPSLIILVGFGRWFRGLFRRDGGKKHARRIRRQNWATMRHLDAILSPRPSEPSTPERTQGLLLLELQSLRTYAQKSFPASDTQLRESFLCDVRELENSGTEAECEVRRVLVERLWRWGTALGWNSIV